MKAGELQRHHHHGGHLRGPAGSSFTEIMR